DAACDMRDGRVGGGKPERGRAAEADHPHELHAGEKEQRAPHEREQHGLPEIGLEHERGESEEEKSERDRVRRHFRAPRRFAEQPGNEDDERRLEEFGGLDVDAEDDNPPPRALHFGAVYERERDEHEARDKYEQRQTADAARLEKRGRE